MMVDEHVDASRTYAAGYAAGIKQGYANGIRQGRTEGYRDAIRWMSRLTTDLHARQTMDLVRAIRYVEDEDHAFAELDEGLRDIAADEPVEQEAWP